MGRRSENGKKVRMNESDAGKALLERVSDYYYYYYLIYTIIDTHGV